MYAQCMRHFSHRHVSPMLRAFEKFLNDPIYTPIELAINLSIVFT